MEDVYDQNLGFVTVYFVIDSLMKKVKIVLVGSMHTGKTSIVNRYVYGDFTLHTVSTTQPAFSQKTLTHKHKEMSLEIWDTAGQERYHALSPLFYRDAEAGIVVFDITDKESFSKASKWISELKQERGNNVFIVLAGNKSDLDSQRVIDKSVALKLAQANKAPYFETSAKTNDNVESVFTAICDNVVERMSSMPSSEPSRSIRSSIQFSDDQKKSEKKCC
ncbi:small GTP-binding protein [Tritrichomonas foetus]|uniref:Small GTP-binding protein n=1 Tax=Tritrichomonas foetus TaxID=1144522 RepID=A0A1J4KAX3_9EUKA|nr:small GTP-binding protein [Tritrichomonas foetus]|eukprot:OHT08048.1 small GTP-binding protein [Tritrichomonas foetus]